ncbi:hypothetical protein MBLNU457_7392t1 [Dothideomycetes sp. NU457]
MVSEREPSSSARGTFHHPYTPYPIQLTLMQAIYDCIDKNQVGIFESPTGTGKSLSLLCSSLTWLRDHKRNIFNDQTGIDNGGTDDEPDWMREHVQKERKQHFLKRRKQLEEKLQAVRDRERKVRERAEGEPDRKRRKLDKHASDQVDDEERFVLDDYDSDDGAKSKRKQDDKLDLSAETRAMMQKLGMVLENKTEQGEIEDELKIFVCSRTHSQLSQMVGELRRIKIPSSFPLDDATGETGQDYPIEEIKQLSLGSRRNLCIHEKVSKLSNQTAINERCLELQDSKTPADQRCPHLPNKENEALALDFQHYALAKIRDIEDLGTLGKKIGVCPYYAARPAVQPSEIVTLPYPLLLQKSAREAVGLDLTDQVIIIDEAHNLMDAILGIYTTEISLAHLQLAKEQLMAYLQKFRMRLKGKNRVYVTQVVRLLDSLIGYLSKIQSQSKETAGTVSSNELLNGKGVDQIDLYKLMTYLQESKLARKVQGYGLHQKEQNEKQQATVQRSQKVDRPADTVPVLQHLQNFIMALTNPEAEGRFFYTSSTSPADTKLRYLLLDPSEHFRDVVESARSVILTGGTMSPMDDYIHQLFPYLPSEKLTTLSCGHVIPASNLFVSAITTSASGTDFDFTFNSRNNTSMIQELGETLISMTKSIPDGVVIFFPSYSYLDVVIKNLKQSPLWSDLEAVKPMFLDSQNADTDATLSAYTAAINSSRPNKGAILMSVIGGKLSEGINFSDALGRCVMVIGLPYPNPNAPEWKARMEYIEAKAATVGGRSYVRGQASREFAENVCMRAVNQAIGRAVRHKDDWAGIVLFDKRYAGLRIRGKLPGWIRESLRSVAPFRVVERGMRDFYGGKAGR